MKILKNANFVIKYQNFQKFSKINKFNTLSFKSNISIKNNNNFLKIDIFSKNFSRINKTDLNIKNIQIPPLSDENLLNTSIPKKLNKIKESEIKQEISQEEKQMVEYFEQFLPLKTLLKMHKRMSKKMINKSDGSKINLINLIEFIQCREFLEANYNLLKKNYKKSEEKFLHIKNILRNTGYLGSYINNINLRRLGISKIMQNKFSEGLLELENVFEYSKEIENFDKIYRFNSMIELLKTYILFFPSKASDFSDKILKDEIELKLLDINQLAELNHYISVRKDIINYIFKIN